MVQCEMCGAETPSPSTVKVEGAELDVCEECTDFGTEVRTEDASSTSTKYSTSSSGSSGGDDGGGPTTRSSSRSTGGSGGSNRGSEMFDDVEELATDYDERIRQAREDAGLSQEDLANQLNEKASLIRKLERGDMLPSDEVQGKLERGLGISLSETASAEDTEWESGSGPGEMTLGDMVERKD